MEWQVKLLKAALYASVRLDLRVPVCVRVLLRETRCSDDLFLARISTVFSRFVRMQISCTSP